MDGSAVGGGEFLPGLDIREDMLTVVISGWRRTLFDSTLMWEIPTNNQNGSKRKLMM